MEKIFLLLTVLLMCWLGVSLTVFVLKKVEIVLTNLAIISFLAIIYSEIIKEDV